MKILVVEDSPIIRAAHIALLQNENYQVDFAEDGIKAHKMIKNRYDVILMDIHLPHINGIDVTIQLRRQKNIGNPIVIGITSDTDKDRLKMCWEVGINEILQKPVTSEQILAAIKKHHR